jgi:hypothetical protein
MDVSRSTFCAIFVEGEVRVMSYCKCVLHQGLAITVTKVRVRRDLLVLGVGRTLLLVVAEPISQLDNIH